MTEPRARWRPSFLVVLTVAWGLLLTTWAVLTPVYEAPDELAHVDAAVATALGEEWLPPGEAVISAAVLETERTQASLPAADRSSFGDLLTARPGASDSVNQMTQHPQTWYLLAGGLLRALSFEDLRWDASVLALRLLDVALALPLPLLVHATIRRTTGSPRAAAVGAVALLAVPQLAQIVSSATNDALTILLAAVVTWAGVRLLTGERRRRDLVLLGVLLGLVLLTKGTGLPAVPFVAVVVLVAGRGRTSLGRRALSALAVLSLAFAIGGWWWLRNLVRYGDVQPSGLAGVRPTIEWPDGSSVDLVAYVDRLWVALSESFWGKFGLVEHAMSPIVTDVLTVVCLVVVVALGFRRGPGRATAWVLASLPLATLAMLVVVTLRAYERTGLMYGIQGRYLFVSLVALLAVSARAWQGLVPGARARRRAARAVAWASVALACYGLLVAWAGFYGRPQDDGDPVGLSGWWASSPVGAVGTVLVATACAVALLVLVAAVPRATRPGQVALLPSPASPAR